MPLPYRMFCLPHAGAGASVYRDWPCRLDGRVDVVAVDLPGRERRMREPLLHSAEELVADVIDGIAEQARRSPAGFGLFGHSMGALVAYELAHALLGRGITPDHLIVSGYGAPHLPLPEPWVHLLPTDELVGHLARLEGTSGDVLSNPDLLEMVLPVIRADYEVCETYRHPARPTLAIPVTALGGDRDPGVAQAGVEAWADLTTGRFHAHILPGGHFFLHDQLDSVLGVIASRHRLASPPREQTMSTDKESSNATRVRRYYELVDAGDIPGLVQLFSPDIEYHRPGYEPLVGRSALEDFYRGQRVIKEGRHTLTSLVVSGDNVAVQGRFAGTLHDGRYLTLRFADFFHIASGGKFSRRDTYFFQPSV